MISKSFEIFWFYVFTCQLHLSSGVLNSKEMPFEHSVVGAFVLGDSLSLLCGYDIGESNGYYLSKTDMMKGL